MIGIIKYKAGNLASVSNALDRLNAPHRITDDSDQLEACDAIIFPGVGHAGSAMDELRSKNLDKWIRKTNKPVLGICLGMQLMYETSEEGATDTLGLIPGRLKKFDSSLGKVPHMGWNQLSSLQKHPLLKGIDQSQYFYFVHGFYAPVNKFTIAACHYITEFAAVAAKDNYLGVQFHPEKSGTAGSLIIQNFLEIIRHRNHLIKNKS